MIHAIDATQDATTHHPNKKEIQKDKEENEEIDIKEMCRTDDESGDGQTQRLAMTWTVKFHLKTMPTMRLIPH